MSLPQKIDIEEEVDFEILDFHFSRYELEDGTMIRVTTLPSKVYRSSQFDSQGYPEYIVMSTQPIVTAMINHDQRTNELKLTTENVSFNPQSDPMDQLEYYSILERWNSYELSDGSLLKCKTVVTGVSKAREKRNNLGEPIYWVNTQLNINIKANEKLRKR